MLITVLATGYARHQHRLGTAKSRAGMGWISLYPEGQDSDCGSCSEHTAHEAQYFEFDFEHQYISPTYYLLHHNIVLAGLRNPVQILL